MMRTRRRLTRQLNKRKTLLLRELITKYAQQKDTYLVELAKTKNWSVWQSSQKVKREFARKYSHHTLPVHIEDQCIFDAISTMIAWVESAKVRDRWKAKVFKQPVEKQIFYFRLFKRYSEIAKVLSGEIRDHWLFHLLRNSLLHPSRIKKYTSAMLDNTNYRVFAEHGKQYISVSCLEKGKRVVIPLLGNVPISGNIRLVYKDNHFEVHTMSNVKTSRNKQNTGDIALDAGTTEVFTDQNNRRYGTDFGRLLSIADKRLVDKGKKRNKIRHAALNKRFEIETERSAYLRKIRKNNLGHKKQNQFREGMKAGFATEINHAFNEVMAQNPNNVIMEDISHMRGRTATKSLSRTVSLWMRSVLKERANFKVEVRGSHLQAVASAYTSQECSNCGFTVKDNRTGDHFRCLNCGTVDTADGNAAKVILKRFYDPEIKPWMNKFHIKRILDRRNAQITGEIPGASCEAEDSYEPTATVNGQTLVFR